MIEDLVVAKAVERSFIVNVRTAGLAPLPANATGGTRVALKPREIGSPTWDDRLTLEIAGDATLRSLSIAPVDLPTLYLAGDSTVTDQGSRAQRELGPDAAALFRRRHRRRQSRRIGRDAEVVRHRTASRQTVVDAQAGDWVMIQFGHNDQKVQWPQTYAEAATTYRSWLRTYIAEVRRRGATPILVTSPERRNFDAAGHIVPSLGDYPDAVRAVAREERVALIDLNPMSMRYYETLGPEVRRAHLPTKAATRRITTNTARMRSRAWWSRDCAPRIPRSPRDSQTISLRTPAASIRAPSPPDFKDAMKHINIISTVLAASPPCSAAPPCAAAEPVNITVRADTPGSVIEPAIYGQFAEHLGRLIYEGIWVGEEFADPEHARLSQRRGRRAQGTRSAGGALARRLLRRRISLARRHRPARTSGRARSTRTGAAWSKTTPSARTSSWISRN